MKKILLVCAAGMSTSMLVNKMRQAAAQQEIAATIEAVGIDKLNEKLAEYDCVLLGPQIRFRLEESQALATAQGKRADVIAIKDYGTMNGAGVLAQALQLIG